MESATTFTNQTTQTDLRQESLLDKALEKGMEKGLAKGWIPDGLIRVGIRRLLAERLRTESEPDTQQLRQRFVETLRDSPIALVPDAANQQHYEVPARFYDLVLGPHRKYSCAQWAANTQDLGTAEEQMLETYLERAQIKDGQTILDLGCGWGSLSLFLASRFPKAQVVGVSNSHSQRRFIEQQAQQRELKNLQVVTADMNQFQPHLFSLDRPFDRVLSIEMFEHMRNYPALLKRISQWMAPDGLLFVHIFCHRNLTYPFEVHGPNDWMARHFFTGGLMPSQHLLPSFDCDLKVSRQWKVDGTHYQRTCEAWLRNLDHNKEEVLALFRETYGSSEAPRWIARWRIFFMACAELFGYQGGREWFVSHYSLVRR